MRGARAIGDPLPSLPSGFDVTDSGGFSVSVGPSSAPNPLVGTAFEALADQVKASLLAQQQPPKTGVFAPSAAAPAPAPVPQKRIKLTLHPAAVAAKAPVATPVVAAAAPGFWSRATTTEKAIIVGGGAGAAWLLYAALA